jgi:hypothetical protein
MAPSLLDRYSQGHCVAVWDDLMALGAAVRSPAYLDDAYAVALATMRRVRDDLRLIHRRLIRLGYQFWVPEQALVPPPATTPGMLAEIEHALGPLPLSLRALYEVVGSVDLRQSPLQLVQWQQPGRATASDVQLLGEEDPLVVDPIGALRDEARLATGRLSYCFAPDEFHKANYSGGENYHVWLPDRNADFKIAGMYGIDEYFVAYLRATLAHGGFRGKLGTLPDDDERGRKVEPRLAIVSTLASGLVPI